MAIGCQQERLSAVSKGASITKLPRSESFLC